MRQMSKKRVDQWTKEISLKRKKSPVVAKKRVALRHQNAYLCIAIQEQTLFKWSEAGFDKVF